MAETALPPLPEGFTLDEPVNDNALPPLPEGFTLDAPVASAKLPALPEGFKLDTPAKEPGIVDKIGQPITDPKQAEAMAKAQGTGTIDYVKNIGAGMGERVLDLFGGFGDLLAATAPGPDSGVKYPYGSGDVQADLQKASQEMHDTSLGYKPGTTWEDVKKSPASNFIAFAVEQGLVSAPDMAAAVAALPAYIAARTGELADERAQNNAAANATVDDLLVAMPAATASALLDRLGGRAMFGLDDVAVQSIKQVPKEVAKATVKEAGTEAVQEGIEDVATTAGTKTGWQPADMAERMLAAALAGGVTGGTVRAGTGTLEAATNTDTPVAGDQSETVETPSILPRETPVTQDGGEEVASPLPSSLPSATPEERAILRRTSMPDEDIDAMSPEERAAKVEEARAAGIRVNGAMVRAAEQYQAPAIQLLPENVPIPAERPQMPVESASPVEAPVDAELPVSAPVRQPEPELTPETQQQLADTVRQSVEADQTQQVEQAVQPVMPQLQQAVQQSVAADQDMQAEQAIAPVRPQLAQTVQDSVAEDIKGDGTRQAPVYVQQPQHIDVAAQRVNTEPSQAQIEAGNYAKGHIKVGGLDITIENPKGSTRTGTSPNGQQWSVNMPAHYGYLKRSSGADGDQVDVYVGDNPASKRVYVVDQRDPATRRWDEHKAIMGVNSVSEARDLYARAFSDQSGFDRLGAITPMSISEFKAWLRDGDTTKPLRMGKGVRLNDQGFPVDIKGAVKKPDSLIEFLARKGGVREDRGELTALGLRDRKTGFVVGAGPLIRHKGMHPDKAREAAAEAGYLPMESSLADFYNALDADARSGRQQFSQYDDDWAMAWRGTVGAEARAADQDAAEADGDYEPNVSTDAERERQAIYIRLLDEGYPGVLGDDFAQRVARYAMAGESFEDAVFYAYDEMRKEALSTTPGMPEIPFFGDEDNEAFARATSEGSESAEAGGFEGNDDGSEVEAERTVEPGAVRGEGRPEAESDGSREDGGRGDRESTAERPAPVKAPVASWVVREKATGNVILETFEKRTADAINKEKYEAVPIQEHLASLNKKPEPKPAEETGADSKPQLVMPGAERASDATMAQRGADAPLKPKAPQKDPGGLFSDDVNEPQLFDQLASDKPVRTYKSESGKKRDMDLLTEVVNRVAGIDPKFAETINLSKEGSKLWGREGVAKARGQYNATDDVITLALDLMNWDAANHEAFHRLQNKFLTDKERAALKSDERRLRAFLVANGEKQASVDKMARVEVEAEAFAKWVAKADQPAKINTILRRAWDRLAKMLRKVRNLLNGRGFKTYEDIFEEASAGKTKERTPREKGVMAESATLYSLVDDRATPEERPAKPKTSVPTTPKPKTRFADQMAVASKYVAAVAKRNGGKYDRLTEGDQETLAELVTRKSLDYLNPVLRMQEKVGADLEDHADAYLTARLAEGTIRHELAQVQEKYVQPAIKELAEVKATEEDLHLYMYAMHVPERNYKVGLRNEEGSDLYKAATDPTIRGASGMSTNEAKDTLRELAKDREKFMGIRRAASHIRAMLDDGLKRQLRAGLINKATYDELTQQWQHYVPLRAESDQDGTGGGMPSKSRGFDVRGDEFKGATGRYTKADNVVNYAVNNAEQSIIRAEKNKAATAALRFINQFDPEGESIAKVYWSEDPDKLGDITKAPPVYRRKLDKDGKVTSVKVNAFQMKDDVLAAKVGGKTYYMQFADPKVGLALKKMTFGELGAAMKLVKMVSNWQSLINTRANPAFIPINFLRDVQTGATIAMSKDFKAGEIAKMVGSIPSAWGALWRDARGKPGSGKWDRVVADFKANGGKISFDQYATVEETAKKIQKELQKATSTHPLRRALNRWGQFVELVENLNDTIENGMRVVIYNGAIEQGKTPKRAAFLARDLTVDFQKKGEITPHMNALYTFFNASVQGNTNFAKALYKSRKVKVAMGALIMAGYAQHVINMALAGDDDDGENAYLKMLRNEPWTFERNIVLFLPGSKDYIKIPLGFGMNAFWHLGNQAGAVTTGDKGFLDATLDSTRVAFDAFNPLGSGGWVSMALPSVIDPIWELGTNQNFSGNPIYPQENQFDPAPPPKSEQAFSSTAGIFKDIAKTMNKWSGGSDKLPGAVDVYPDSLEYLWGWISGGIGRFASQTYETADRGVDLDFEPKKTPFIRSFYGAVDDQGKRSEYFAQRERVQYVKGKVKEFKEAGDEQGLKDFIADNQQDYDAVKAFEIAEKQRRRINKLRRQNEKRPDAADDLKALDEQELEIMNQARKAYFEAKPDAAE